MFRKLVFTNGVFDLFHDGHRHILRQCAKHYGILLVAVNSDHSVRLLKGASRPIDTCDTRIQNVTHFLSSLPPPRNFLVFEFDDVTPESLIQKLRPDVLVKGSDARRPLAGENDVTQHGGHIQIIERLPGLSTTALLQQGTRHDSGI